jgi:hypothetical protein
MHRPRRRWHLRVPELSTPRSTAEQRAKLTRKDCRGQHVGRVRLDRLEQLHLLPLEHTRHPLHVKLFLRDPGKSGLERGVEGFEKGRGNGGEVNGQD